MSYNNNNGSYFLSLPFVLVMEEHCVYSWNKDSIWTITYTSIGKVKTVIAMSSSERLSAIALTQPLRKPSCVFLAMVPCCGRFILHLNKRIRENKRMLKRILKHVWIDPILLKKENHNCTITEGSSNKHINIYSLIVRSCSFPVQWKPYL